MGTRGRTLRRIPIGASLLVALLVGLPSGPAPAGAAWRISNMSLFSHDYDATAPALEKKEMCYVGVGSDGSLGGVNSWFARMAGEAEETPWVQSSLLTPVRNQ